MNHKQCGDSNFQTIVSVPYPLWVQFIRRMTHINKLEWALELELDPQYRDVKWTTPTAEKMLVVFLILQLKFEAVNVVDGILT